MASNLKSLHLVTFCPPNLAIFSLRLLRTPKGICKVIIEVKGGKITGLAIDPKGVLWLEDRLCIPTEGDLKREILDEAHKSAYAMHLDVTKMYQDLK